MPLKLNSSGGGSVTLDVPVTGSALTVTVPALTGTVVTTGDTGTVTETMLAANSVNTAEIVASAVTPAKLSQPFTRMTANSSTSGTVVDFTGIPAWVNRITVMLFGVSLSGTDRVLIQVGTSSGVTITGYQSYTSDAGATSTAGFILGGATATDTRYGVITIVNQDGFKWISTGMNNSSTTTNYTSIGQVTLAATLDRVRITATGTNTFDAGSINVMYE